MQENSQIRYWSEQVALFNDGTAFRKLFVHFNNNLYKLAFSMVGSKEIAEDVLSEVFANLWQGRARLLEVDNLTVYLYVAVKNLCVRHLTRTRKEGVFNLDDIDLQSIPTPLRTPEDLTISREMVRLINEAVASLPPKCRMIFQLIREDGLSYRDVSQILDLSIKTIDAQMAIASKKIAERINFLLKK